MPTLDNRGSGLQDRAVGGAEAVPVHEPGEEGTGLGSNGLTPSSGQQRPLLLPMKRNPFPSSLREPSDLPLSR